ncbi:hypothetical protein ACLOJK_008622 [Asimina triloba]
MLAGVCSKPSPIKDKSRGSRMKTKGEAPSGPHSTQCPSGYQLTPYDDDDKLSVFCTTSPTSINSPSTATNQKRTRRKASSQKNEEELSMGDFQESDVIWADHLSPFDDPYRPICPGPDGHPQRKEEGSSSSAAASPFSSSPPVRIPAVRGAWKLEFMRRIGGDEDAEDEGEMVPPHETVARRIAGKMAFSVCTGNGRTLKGRDLSKVRNSVLRMTGFLEG